MRYGIDDNGTLITEKSQINLYNDATFRYAVLNTASTVSSEVTEKIIGYIDRGEELINEHKSNYNPDIIKFLSASDNPNLETSTTNNFNCNSNLEYKAIATDKTTSTITLVGGENSLNENN